MLALVVVPSSPCRCPSYLQHPYRRQLDQDRRSPGALPSRVSISISVPLTASRPIPPWPRPCCWLLCTHSRLPPCLGWTASVASFPDRVQAAQQPTAASRDTATASPANTARAFPAFVGSAGDEYRLLLLLLHSNERCLGWPTSFAALCGRWAGCRRRASAAFLLEAVCTPHVGWCCSRPDATTHAVRPVCRLSSRCPSTPPPCFRLGTRGCAVGERVGERGDREGKEDNKEKQKNNTITKPPNPQPNNPTNPPTNRSWSWSIFLLPLRTLHTLHARTTASEQPDPALYRLGPKFLQAKPGGDGARARAWGQQPTHANSPLTLSATATLRAQEASSPRPCP